MTDDDDDNDNVLLYRIVVLHPVGCIVWLDKVLLGYDVLYTLKLKYE